MKRVAIVQSNYIPWKGYFDMIAAVDEFVLYDDMQYTRRDWRNRNQIKTPQGVQWLTVPVSAKGKYHQKIRETEIDGSEWSANHLKALKLNYQRALHFEEISSWLEPIFMKNAYSHLSHLNRKLIEEVCAYLGIKTKISNSWDYFLPEGKTERLVSICQQASATEYVSGPAAKEYVDEGLFAAAGIEVEWFSYADYPQYQQLWGEFSHGVTILDLLFNCGKTAENHMKFVKKAQTPRKT